MLRKSDIHWEKIALIGRLKAVKASALWLVILPVVIAFFSLAPEKTCVAYNQSGNASQFCFPTTLPIQWAAGYFAATFFSIGSWLYEIYCPPIIKQIDSKNIVKGKNPSKDLIYGYYRFIKHKNNVLNESNLKIFEERYLDNQTNKITDDKASEAYLYLIKLSTVLVTIPRILCFICFCIGFSLLFAIFVINSIRVFAHYSGM